MTTTKTRPLTARDRFDAAQKRLDRATADGSAAQERLTALRERHKADGSVTAEEFATAAAAVELADLDRQGAEANFAEARQAARLEKLAEIRADIEVHADPAKAAAAFEWAAEALAGLIKEIGPGRRSLVSGWAGQLMDLGIEPVASYSSDPGAEEDDGFTCRTVPGGGQIGSVSWTVGDDERRAVHASFDMDAMLASLVSRACAKAQAPAFLFNAGPGLQDLIKDPEEWFKRHN